LAANDALDANANSSALAARAVRPLVIMVLPCDVIIGPPELRRANEVVWWVAVRMEASSKVKKSAAAPQRG
jgi:hypothetical protein